MNKEELFEEKLLEMLEEHGIIADYCIYGIKATYRHDTWYIQVQSVNSSLSAENEPHAFIKLHHKNLFTTRRSQNDPFSGGVPDSHLQKKGEMTIDQLIKYLINHGKKYTSDDPNVKKIRKQRTCVA